MTIKKFRSSYGFTLIELSVVLIIIGLLIGGLIAARASIQTARLTKAVKDLSQAEVALQTYRSLYNELPGDGFMYTGCPNGDSNVDYTSESPYVWYHLSLGVDLKAANGNNYPLPTYQVMTPKLNCPAFDLEQIPGSASCLIFAGNMFGYSKNIFIYGNYATASTSCTTYSPILPKDAAALDRKLDDGFANSGKITDAFGDTTCSSGTSYTTSITATGCTMHFDSDIFTGNK